MTAGLLFTSLMLGVRHGIDWDHIAAITDLSGTAESRRRGFLLSFLYAVGHAVVVFVLGCGVLLLGTTIPEALDDVMGRIVGLTLVLLGVWVLVGLVRHGRDFRLRSRWILIIDGTFAGLRKVRTRRSMRSVSIEHDHEHHHDHETHTASFAHDHAHARTGADTRVEVPAGGTHHAAHRPWHHRHEHHHQLALPTTASARYGNGTATGIGMLHGVGVESPTQIAIFVASTSVVGAWAGLGLLTAWVIGLIAANSALALLAGFGLLHAERNFALYATLAVLVGVLSVCMGLLFIGGFDALPGLAV